MSGILKVIGALSALLLIVCLVLGVPVPWWNLVILLGSTVRGVRIWIRDRDRAAYENDLNAEIYGQDEKGRPKKPTYHHY
jgi:hypothetical protein